jgi:hypothetical protein
MVLHQRTYPPHDRPLRVTPRNILSPRRTVLIASGGVKSLVCNHWFEISEPRRTLHVVERYAAREAEDRGERNNFRLANSDPGFAPDLNYKDKGLQLRFTVEDDGVFTTPWTAGITYRRNIARGRLPRCRPRTKRISNARSSSQDRQGPTDKGAPSCGLACRQRSQPLGRALR